jgi:uncharacterized protein
MRRLARRFLAWRGVDDEWRAEACTAELGADGLRATGVQLAAAYRLDYQLRTTPDLLTEQLLLELHDAGGARSLDLRRCTDGAWAAEGTPQPQVEGALDCDLAFSPLTNFMPAARLSGEPVDHVMAWVSLPDLAVLRSGQRYEPLGERRVRYVSLDDDFTAELELDEDGFVVSYPGLAERAER